MFSSCVDILARGIKAVVTWFSNITNAIPGSWAFFLAFFVMFVSYRAILVPLIGSAGRSFHEARPKGYSSKED